MHAMIGRNMLLAVLLSLPLTLALAVLYTFYPLISAILRTVWKGISSSSPHSSGVAVVAGGVSESFLKTLVIVAAIIFLLIFALLQKRSMKH